MGLPAYLLPFKWKGKGKIMVRFEIKAKMSQIPTNGPAPIKA